MAPENPENPIRPEQSAQDTNTETKDHQGKPDPSIEPAALIPDPPPPPPKQHEIAVNIKRDRIDWWTLRMEGFGLFVLCVYTVFTALMYCANKKAAEAAKSANTIATKTMRITQRAWVSPHLIHQIFNENQPLVVSTQFDNTGETPAIHVQTCEVAEIVENTRKDVDISCPERAKSPGFDIVFPKGSLSRIANATGDGGKTRIDPEGLLRKPLMTALRKGDKSVYVYGRVDYWDVFQKPHWATFCSTMLIMPPTPGGMPETISWIVCRNGNDVDPEEP
jgi:hypothetical protein